MSGKEFSAVFEVSHEELFHDIIDAYHTKMPLFIWGRTGIGKSYTVRKVAEYLAKKMGRNFTDRIEEIDNEHFVLLDRRLTMMDPTDLLGVLYKENGVSNWHPPKWLYLISRQREEKEGVEVKGILFLDELNLAPELVQNASYQLILDRRVGDIELADGIAVIGAGNVAEDRAFTFDLPDPLKTRFTHVTLKVPVFKDPEKKEGWYYWAIENNIDSRILAFLEFKPDMLFKHIEGDRTFPTPRGWENSSRLMKGKPNDEAWRAVAKACGFVAGLQFRDFMNLSKDINLDEILEYPEEFFRLRIDVQLSVIASLTNLYQQNPKKYCEKLIKFSAQLHTGLDTFKLEELVEELSKVPMTDIDRTIELINRYSEEYGNGKYSELVALLLSGLNSADSDELKKALKKSKYIRILFDLIRFLAF